MLQERQPLSDADVLAMPYARLMGKLENMMARLADDYREKRQLVAFGVWQHYQFHPLAKGKKPPTLEQYLRRLGIHDPSPDDSLAPEDKAAMLAAIEADQNELRAAMAQAAQERQAHQWQT